MALFAAWLALGVPLACAQVPAGYYADQKVVYHNGGDARDNAAYFQHLLANLHNHIAAVGKAHVQIRVVDLADGVVLFQMANTDAGIAHAIDALRADGVWFLICKNTLVARKLDWHTLYGVKEADLVPSGVAELARLQGMGFVYIHP